MHTLPRFSVTSFPIKLHNIGQGTVPLKGIIDFLWAGASYSSPTPMDKKVRKASII